MAPIPEETLRQVLEQLVARQHQNQKSLNLTLAQSEARTRQLRVLELSLEELNSVPEDDGSKMYSSVGKMFVSEPIKKVKDKVKVEIKEAKEESGVLKKKQKYLENEIKTAQRGLQEIFHQQQIA